MDNTYVPPTQTVSPAYPPQQPYSSVGVPQYGYPAQPVPPPKKKNVWKIVGIVVAAILGLSILGNMLNSGGSSGVASSSINSTSGVESSSVSQSVSTEQISLDTAAAIAETFFSGNFENYAVEYDETGFTASIWADGIAAAAMLARQGDENVLKEWEYLKTQTINLSNSTKEYFKNVGWPDMVVAINLLNDNNLDKILLMVIDGVVVYDVVNS
jgi:hypothetical protein